MPPAPPPPPTLTGARRRVARAGVAALALASAGATAAAAPGDPARLRLPSGGHATVVLELLPEGGPPAAQWLVADDRPAPGEGWLRDRDPRPGWVAVSLDALWLPAGRWSWRARAPGEAEPLWTATAEGAAGAWPGSRTAAVGDGELLVGHLRRPGAGLLVSPVEAGQARLPDDPHVWELSVVGGAAHRARRIGPQTPRPDLSQPEPPRPDPPPGRPLLGLLLTLAGLGTVAAGAAVLRAALPAVGRRAAVALSAALGLLVTAPVLGGLGSRLLATGGPVRDPQDSVALLALVASDLPLLDGGASAMAWPDGASWLAAGPAWVPYGLLAPLTWALGPVVAHNVGVGLGAALLSLAAIALARDRGASPGPALLAGAAAVLAPVVLDEWDALSLDRAALCVAPLTVLALARCARGADRAAPLWAGALVGGGLYLQVYYGLYLAVLAPLFALLLLLGEAPMARLRRLGLAGLIALLVALPGLHTLRTATVGTGPAERAAGETTALLEPIPAQEAQASLDAQAAAVAAGVQDPLSMARPRDRVLSAASRAWSADAALWPRGLLVGGPWLLWMLGAGVLLARRRGPAARSVGEVALLLGLSLGPVLLWQGRWTGIRLPWLAFAAGIPGFDQLKNVYRFGLLAAALAGVPLALLLDGLLHRLRLPRAAQHAGVGLALLLVFGAHFEDARRGGLRLGLPASGRALPVAAAPGDASGPVVVVPLATPPAPGALLPALQGGAPLVNPSPVDQPPDAPTPRWDDQPALNLLARWSGDPLTDRTLSADLGAALVELAASGVREIAVLPDALSDPALAREIELQLAPHLGPPRTDGPWQRYRLPAPPPPRR